jgi:cytoskeletal protein RodZ
VANLAPTQIEQLQKIGSYLCQQRQNQGLSLDFVANQTFIRPVILQALESGRYEDLPQPIFIQGFIRRYADSLGLDGKALSQEFSLVSPDLNPVYDVLSQERKVKGPISNGTAPVVSEQLAVPPESPQPPLPAASSPRRSSTRPVSSKPVIPISAFLFLGLGLAVLGVGWFLWKGWGESVQSTSTVAPKENLVSPQGLRIQRCQSLPLLRSSPLLRLW